MIETLIWLAIIVAVAVLVWVAEPYHTRLIDAVHGRAAEKEDRRKSWLGRLRK
jgi:hypothetical protein